MLKCERCGLEGDYTQIKTCPEKITLWGNKPICKKCYLYLKEVEENKVSKEKTKSQIKSNKSLNSNFNNKKSLTGKATDYIIFLIQFLGVLIIPMPLFYFGLKDWNFSLLNPLGILLIINIILSITMIFIFFRESKKRVGKPHFQTFIFGISLIPFILSIHWVLSLVIPQLTYWYFKKSSW
ncbi:MAG: hypothetical protein AYK22_00520 [Thermoplasmatales archaeon SG8-52-3]|nr:MAG: hypothetical protein AYK22_00520 [Thermoplasmatales archaeon SG8-52-3]